MGRSIVVVTLPGEPMEMLRAQANAERIPITTLAARYVIAGLEAATGKAAKAGPVGELTDWLSPHIDAIRNAGTWSSDVAVGIFEQIEKEKLELYQAAAMEVGAGTLNKLLGRFIRGRLGAEVVRRNGKPHLARVQPGRTTLIKFFTHLKP